MNNLTCGIALACLLPGLGAAQGAEPGGLQYGFAFRQELEATTDRDLSDSTETAGRDGTTSLSFTLSDATRTEDLSFGLSSGLRITDGEATAIDPRANVRYSRNSANAALDLNASWTRSDIAFLRETTDFVNADGVLELPSDLDDLTGSGTRTIQTYGTALRWGIAGPAELRISFGQTLLRYDNANDSLIDADTTRLGTGARLTLSPVLSANLSLDHTRYAPQGAPLEKTTQFGAGLTLDRPRGAISTRVTATRADDGDLSWGLSLGRGLELPGSALNLNLGLTQDRAGDAQITGSVNYAQDLPGGQISLGARQGIATGGANDGQRSTSVQASYAQELTPLSNLQLGFDYGRERSSDGSSDLASGSLSARYGLRLTPDWQLSLGTRANLRETNQSPRATSQSVFVSLDRSWTFRP